MYPHYDHQAITGYHLRLRSQRQALSVPVQIHRPNGYPDSSNRFFDTDSSDMKKLLFITPELPYPPQSGGKVKSLKLLHALAEKYQVTLACPLKMEDAQYVEEFYAISPCAHHLHQEVRILLTPSNLILSYLRGIPLNVHRTYNEQLQNNIAALASEQDVVFLDHYEVYPYLPTDYQGMAVYHAHNAYFKMWERYAQLPGNPVIIHNVTDSLSYSIADWHAPCSQSANRNYTTT
jgi:hypothetical protein